jgi:hypothetical protein
MPGPSSATVIDSRPAVPSPGVTRTAPRADFSAF